MKLLWRVLLVLGTFLVVGYSTMRVLIARAVSLGSPEYAVRLGGAMGGLFAGGAVASLVALALLLGGKRTKTDPED